MKRSTSSGGPYTAVATGLTGNMYLDTGLANGVPYYYVVTASNAAGESANSVEISATPSSDNLDIPNLSFEAPVISTYQYAPTGGSWSFGTHAGISRNSSSFTSANTEAPDGMQVSFVQGTSTMSQSVSGFQTGNVYSVVMTAAQRNNSQPAQAWNVTADGTAVASFTPPAFATEYATYVTPGFTTTNGSHTIAIVGTAPSSSNSTMFIDKVSIVGTSGAPSAPTGVEALAGNNHVVINWSRAVGAASYNVLRSLTSGGPYTSIASGISAVTYDDTTASNGST